MADTADKTKNWADMDHDEGEDEHEELGLQGAGAKKEEEVKKETTEEAPAQTGDKPYKKQRKDYGAAYDPNYKKNKWRKGGAEEFKKNVVVQALAIYEKIMCVPKLAAIITEQE